MHYLAENSLVRGKDAEGVFFIIESKGARWAVCGARQLGGYETAGLALAGVVKAIITFPDLDVTMNVVGRDDDGKTKIVWRQNYPEHLGARDGRPEAGARNSDQ